MPRMQAVFAPKGSEEKRQGVYSVSRSLGAGPIPRIGVQPMWFAGRKRSNIAKNMVARGPQNTKQGCPYDRYSPYTQPSRGREIEKIELSII